MRSHDLGLPGQLARALRAETGRGVDVDLLADPRDAARLAAAARREARAHHDWSGVAAATAEVYARAQR